MVNYADAESNLALEYVSKRSLLKNKTSESV